MNRLYLISCFLFCFVSSTFSQTPQYFTSADRPVVNNNFRMLGDVLDIASDTADNLYILGRFRDEITFTFDDGEELTFEESENDNDHIDLFISVIDCDGNLNWAGHLPTMDSLFTGQIGVDIDSNLFVYYVTQVIQTDIDPDENTENWVPAVPNPSIVRRNIAKFNPDGILLSNTVFEGEFITQAIPSDLFLSGAFTVTQNGALYLAFPMNYGTISFPGYADFTTNSGSIPTFVIQMNGNGIVGDHLLLHNPLGNASDIIIPSGISIGNNGEVLLSGYHGGEVDFAPVDGPSDSIVISSAKDTFDIFAASLDFNDDELLWLWTSKNSTLFPNSIIGQSLLHASTSNAVFLLQKEEFIVSPGFKSTDYTLHRIEAIDGENMISDSLNNFPMDTTAIGETDSIVYTDLITLNTNTLMLSGYGQKNFDLDPDPVEDDTLDYVNTNQAMFISIFDPGLGYAGSIILTSDGMDSITQLNRILPSIDGRHIFTSGLYSSQVNFDPQAQLPEYRKNPISEVDHFFLRYEFSPLPLTILANGEPIPPQGVTICPGESVELSVLEELDSYKWSNDETTQSITVSDPNVYSVEGMRGCDNFQGAQNVIQPQLGQPLIGDHTICGNEIIILDATSFGAEEYIWEDGSIDPIRMVEEIGTYSVTVSNVCESKSASGTVEFDKITIGKLVQMPNAFTPNNDDNNDVLKPIVADTEVAEYTYSVYNRWGQKVFETNDSTKGWNGTHNGTKAPQDVYIWIVRAKIEDCNGTLIEWDDKGDATLLR